MVIKSELISMLAEANKFEEALIYDLEKLLNEKIMEMRLEPAKEKQAKTLMQVLIDDSTRHNKMILEIYNDIKQSDTNEY